MRKQGGSFTFHLASPVKGSCRGICGRGRSAGQYSPAVPQADQTPPPLPAHPVSSSLATHAPQQSGKPTETKRETRFPDDVPSDLPRGQPAAPGLPETHRWFRRQAVGETAQSLVVEEHQPTMAAEVSISRSH